MLHQRRRKQEQQAKTMHKIQCLAIAREALSGTFLHCMEHMKENHAFRNRFRDQLDVQYRDWLYKKVDEELLKGEKSEAFQGTLVVAEVDNFRVTKEAIKKAYESKMAKKEKIRQIESSNSRTVHFLFNPGVPTKIQPFTRKYEKLIQGYNVLADFETAEKEVFQKFVEEIEAESLP